MKSLVCAVLASCVLFAATSTARADEGDGLDEVNAKRAERGLPPFVRDPGLTEAARACAAFRAQHLLFGHTANDFGFLPAGVSASSAGCAAYPAHYGWLSCCTYEGYTHAGAAWVTGADGKRYMHLFVSNPVVAGVYGVQTTTQTVRYTERSRFRFRGRVETYTVPQMSVPVPSPAPPAIPKKEVPKVTPPAAPVTLVTGGCVGGNCEAPTRLRLIQRLRIR